MSKEKPIEFSSSDDDEYNYSSSSEEEDDEDDLQKVRKAQHEKYKRKQRGPPKKSKSIHIDEYEIVQEYWNKEFGLNCMTIKDAANIYTKENQTFEESTSQISAARAQEIHRRLTIMNRQIIFMQSLLHDKRAKEQQESAAQKQQRDIEEAIDVIASLKPDDNVKNIRRAQYSRTVLNRMEREGKLSDGQKARFEQAKGRATKAAPNLLNRRYM